MKILQVYPRFAFERGGVQRYIEGLAKKLAIKGNTVNILTLEKEFFEFSKDSLTIERPTVIRSIEEICTKDYDIIHTHGFRTPYSSLVGLLRKIRGEPVIMTVHTFFPKRNTFDALSKCAYDLSIGKMTLKNFNHFIGINSDIYNRLLDIGVQREKVSLIPNSINIDDFKSLPSPDLFLKETRIPSNKDIILMVGRIDWQKGLDKAIKTFAEVNKSHKKASLVIVGKDFGFKAYLQELAKQYGIQHDVIFTGELSEEALRSAYGYAKVLLMTSVYEGVPTVLLEAMASGLPVVSTPLIGVSELIPNGCGVIWCKENLSETINAILLDTNLRQNIAFQAKLTVKKYFDWGMNSDKILDVYKSVLK